MTTSITLFNTKGGVGKTTLLYHLAYMLHELGERVLLVDLDPQSDLTAMCLSEDRLSELWPLEGDHEHTIVGSVLPIVKGTGDISEPHLEALRPGLALIAGDLGLSRFEDRLSDAWPRALDRDPAAFRTLSAFYRIAQRGAEAHGASLALVDVGPNLGAINRAALLASDHIITPLAPDLFSTQGLRNLGPTLRSWRRNWQDRLERRPMDDLELPEGRMNPLGYIVMQAGMRLSRPVKAYQRWLSRTPGEYQKSVLESDARPSSTEEDRDCLGIMRSYQSLMPLAQDAQKPMFELKPGDGAIGAHARAVRRCFDDLRQLAEVILQRVRDESAALSRGGRTAGSA